MMKRGDAVGLVDGAEEDRSGNADSAGRETSQGEHEVKGGRSGPEKPRRNGGGSPGRSRWLGDDGSGCKRARELQDSLLALWCAREKKERRM